MIQKELATTLERIGFTPGESKVYLALLGLGSTSSGKIILESGVSRSKVYEILDRLTEKGLVTQVIRENTKYFQAASPERISDYIGRKEVEIEREKHEFQSALPALRQMAAEHDEEQSAKVYVGFEGIKTFYDDILREAKKDDEYLALTFSDESMNNNSINNLFRIFHRKRAQQGIKAKILCHAEDKLTQERMNYTSTGNYEFKLTQQELPAGIAIIKDKVATFNWGREPRVFVIKCKENAQQYKRFFNNIWTQATP